MLVRLTAMVDPDSCFGNVIKVIKKSLSLLRSLFKGEREEEGEKGNFLHYIY